MRKTESKSKDHAAVKSELEQLTARAEAALVRLRAKRAALRTPPLRIVKVK